MSGRDPQADRVRQDARAHRQANALATARGRHDWRSLSFVARVAAEGSHGEPAKFVVKRLFKDGEDLRKIQKPRSARPTQLNANIEQAIAANDARVVIALTKRMSRVLCEIDLTLFNDLSAMMASAGRDE